MPIAVAAVIVALAAAAAPTQDARAAFDTHFVDRTMRIDLVHVGNATEELYTVDRVLEQGAWAGSLVHLLDTAGTGTYLAKLVDPVSGTVLFSRGYDCYFGEYRTTAAAGQGMRRSYHESLLFPLPKAKLRLAIERRRRDRSLARLFEADIDPAAYTVVRESLTAGVTVISPLVCGDPHGCVDLAIIAEGYTAAEEAKFRNDVGRAVEILFAKQPFARSRARFNVYGVLAPSQESGCDEPSRGVWRNTAVGASFDSLGSERYMLTEDNRALANVAAHVPYDTLLIMVNQARYGGGGIYHAFSTFTTDNQWTPHLLVHEFGHAFAGLGDEYYTSSVAYNEFYPAGVEPTEANLTALLDPASLKWKDLVTPDTTLPTPWEKVDYDAMDIAYQKVREEHNAKIAKVMRDGGPVAEVEALKQDGEELSAAHARKIAAYLAASAFVGKVGAFEGAGYAAKGLYRPALDCIMFTKTAAAFCPVCERAIQSVIDTYGE